MGVAATVESFLKQQGLPYELVTHQYAEGSYNTAQAAHVPLENLAKGVVFRDQDFQYTMVVVPSGNRIRRYTLNQLLGRSLTLAEEEELQDLFKDCASGAIPPLGQAYGMNLLWDDQLSSASKIYLESGDHCQLIQLNGGDFVQLMEPYLHDRISECKYPHH